MYQQIKELVKQFCIENGRYHVNVEKSLYLNRAAILNDGCTCMFFEDGKSEPTLVAKGAFANKRKDVYRAEHQVLTELRLIGINRDSPMVPEPLGIWDDGNRVVTIESALPGTPVKNLAGKDLFSPARHSTTIDQVVDWCKHLQSSFGIKQVRITDDVYQRDVIDLLNRYNRRFLTNNIESEFLEQRLFNEKRLLGLEVPYMVRHADLVTSNMVIHSGGIGVFDWEYPLNHLTPLFDLFIFFSSLRYPFTGSRGASSHFKSFICVYWGENYLNDKMRNCIQDLCKLFKIPLEAVADLFLIALLQRANMKFDSLLSKYGVTENDTTAEGLNDEKKPLRWDALHYVDEDTPFARIKAGTFENIRYIADNGLPNFTE